MKLQSLWLQSLHSGHSLQRLADMGCSQGVAFLLLQAFCMLQADLFWEEYHNAKTDGADANSRQ